MTKNVFGVFRSSEVDGYKAEYTTVGDHEIKEKRQISDYKGVHFPSNTQMCILRDDKNNVVEIRYNDPKHSYEFVPYGSRYGHVHFYVKGNDDGKIVEDRDLKKTKEYICQPSETARLSADEPVIVETLVAIRDENGKELYTFDPQTGVRKEYDIHGNLHSETLEDGTQIEYKRDSESKKYYKHRETSKDHTQVTEFYPTGQKREVVLYDQKDHTRKSYFYNQEGALKQVAYENGQDQIRIQKKGEQFAVIVNGKEMTKENLELKQEALQTLVGKYFGKTNPDQIGKENAENVAKTQTWASQILMNHFKGRE